MLKELKYNTGKPDGVYGSKTESAIKQFQKNNGLKADGIVGNQTLTALQTLYGVRNAQDSVKADAKASIANAKTGGIKDDTILMSTKTFNNALENVAAVRTATGGGSVQTEIKSNTVVITGATVKSGNSASADVKVTAGKGIQADSDKDVAKFSSVVSNEAKNQEKIAASLKVSGSTSSLGNKTSSTTNSTKTAVTGGPQYIISAASDNLVSVNYPRISAAAGLALGLDAGTFGISEQVMDAAYALTGKPYSAQDVINYNKETTYKFRDSYNGGKSVGIIATAALAFEGIVEGIIVKGVTEGMGKINNAPKIKGARISEGGE